MISFAISARQIAASDPFIRMHVVKIYSKKGSCTGTLAKAHSRVVILTAAHCRAVLDNGLAWAEREDGSKYPTKMLKYNAATDVMLMTTPDKAFLPVAASVAKHEKVHSLTHGGGHMTYRSDGELMEEQKIDVAMFMITDRKSYHECIKEKNQESVASLFGMLCVSHLTNTWSTMRVIAGSSGGAVLNDRGEIVGVVSTGNEDGLSGLVALRHIQAMLDAN